MTQFLERINRRGSAFRKGNQTAPLETAINSLRLVLDEQERVEPDHQHAERHGREERLLHYDLAFLQRRLQEAPSTLDYSCDTAVYDSPQMDVMAGFKQNLAHLLTDNSNSKQESFAPGSQQQPQGFSGRKHQVLPQGVSPGRKLLHDGRGMLTPGASTTSMIRTPASAGGTALSPLQARTFQFQTPQPQLPSRSSWRSDGSSRQPTR
jgi:hypothetical protein